MVSGNTNPTEEFYLDPNDMGISGVGLFATAATPCTAAAANTTLVSSEDVAKRIRKPYTITKSRESWTEPEHDKFLEALHLFDRDWKKIEAFIGSKTAIQIRSHAQKYFLKVQKNGINEHLPPPRPKRKADHPYPQKASKNAPVVPQARGSFQCPSTLFETDNVIGPNGSLLLPMSNTDASALTINPAQTTALSHAYKSDLKLEPIVTNNCGINTESTPITWQSGEATDKENHVYPPIVLPDFGQVYNFIGSVFDPDVTGHMQKLKKMDPINVETVLLLMRNLSMNLTSPIFFEDHKRLLSYGGTNSDGSNDVQSGTEFG